MLDDDIINAIRERQSARAHIARSIGAPVPGAGSIPKAPAMPRRLPVLAEPIAASDVHRGDDRFRCDRLACELTAEACIERQQMGNQRRRRAVLLNRYQLAEAASASHMASCKNCQTGRRIAARLGVEIVESSGNAHVDDELFRGVQAKERRRSPEERRP